MEKEKSFGKFVKDKRQFFGLTQAELARRVGSATITIRKIEADAIRPSVQIGELLAVALNIPLEERAAFVRRARQPIGTTPEPPPTPTPYPSPEEIGSEDLSGRAVRGYQLADRIGEGGFGAVYRAVQPNIEREVAIKIILPRYANNPDFIRRFEAEAQMVARLEHPFIVPLYDYWREPNAAYLVMRLLRGGSLKDELKDGALPVERVIYVIEQISLALHTAHRFGVIHREQRFQRCPIIRDKRWTRSFRQMAAASQVPLKMGLPASGILKRVRHKWYYTAMPARSNLLIGRQMERTSSPVGATVCRAFGMHPAGMCCSRFQDISKRL